MKRGKSNFITLVALIFCVLFFTQTVAAEDPPPIQWQKTFGGLETEYGSRLIQTSDGGFVFITDFVNEQTGDEHCILSKTDCDGNLLWEKIFEGYGNSSPVDLQQTPDNGFIIVGYTYPHFNPQKIQDIHLIKTDSLGNLQWEKILSVGGRGNFGDSVRNTADGGFIICGQAEPDYPWYPMAYLIKTDGFGNKQWQRTFGGNHSHASCVRQTADGGFIVCGMTYAFGNGLSDVYLAKTDSDGNILWQKTYGGPLHEWGDDIQITSDGGFVILGYTDVNSDILLIKTDSLGNVQWQKLYGGVRREYDSGVQQTEDGDFIIIGTTYSYGTGIPNCYLIKTDNMGNTLWQKIIGGIQEDFGVDVKTTYDGGYVVSGFTSSFGQGKMDAYLVKIAPEKGSHDKNKDQK